MSNFDLRVVCAILIIVIEDLELRCGNANLPLEKNVIRFESQAQKEEIDKQIAGTLYNKY